MPDRQKCPVCGYDNRAGAVACDDCGLLLPKYVACASCGFMNTSDSSFCGDCGASLGVGLRSAGVPPAPVPASPGAAGVSPAPVLPSPGAVGVSPAPALPSPGAAGVPPAPVPAAPGAVGVSPAPVPPSPGAVGVSPAPVPAAPAPGVDPLVGTGGAPWSGPTFQLVHAGTEVAITLPLRDGSLAIGRPGGDPDIDLSGFPESGVVSRKHARLSIAGNAVTLEDLGSANGTYVNSVRLSSPRVLADGDRLAFGQGGKVLFTVRLS